MRTLALVMLLSVWTVPVWSGEGKEDANEGAQTTATTQEAQDDIDGSRLPVFRPGAESGGAGAALASERDDTQGIMPSIRAICTEIYNNWCACTAELARCNTEPCTTSCEDDPL